MWFCPPSSGDGGNRGDSIVESYADGYELGKERGKNDDRNTVVLMQLVQTEAVYHTV